MAMKDNENKCIDDNIIYWRKWSADTTLAILGEVQGENLINFREIEVTCCIKTVAANEFSESILCTEASLLSYVVIKLLHLY